MLLQHMDECGRLVARARVRARVYVAIQVFGARSLTHFHRSLALALIVAYLRVLVCVCWVRQLFTPECVLIRSYTFDSLGFHSHNPWLFASFFVLYVVVVVVYCAKCNFTWLSKHDEDKRIRIRALPLSYIRMSYLNG